MDFSVQGECPAGMACETGRIQSINRLLYQLLLFFLLFKNKKKKKKGSALLQKPEEKLIFFLQEANTKITCFF